MGLVDGYSTPPLAKSLEELSRMSDLELREAHADLVQPGVVVGESYYREELNRRQADRVLRQSRNLTWVIAALTLANTGAVIYQAVHG